MSDKWEQAIFIPIATATYTFCIPIEKKDQQFF